MYGSWEQTSSCDYCDGDYLMECEGPDYEVGLMGYSVFIDNTEFSTHADDCPVRFMTPQDIEKIEYDLSIKLANGEFDYEP